MYKLNYTPLLILSITFFLSCSSEKKSQEATNSGGNIEVRRVGFNSIQDLTKSVINSLISEDYESYLSHVMTEKNERSQAELIEDKAIRKEFLKEFSFSIKEEKVYFDNMLKALKEDGLDLNKSLLNELEVFDYVDGKYSPVVLKEVIVPIPKNDYEEDLVFVAIEINGLWYLTAELGL